ncbi:unnamed protein product [Closterium sp. Naga37s-1]|nr:unnamed protein product [Closterium sp. Naga37s-1]
MRQNYAGGQQGGRVPLAAAGMRMACLPFKAACMWDAVSPGYVGNKAAVFPLQLLGFDVDPINSVQLSNHTGYPTWKGQILDGEQLWALIEGLEANGLLFYSHLLTGGLHRIALVPGDCYTGSLSFLETVLRVVEKLRSVNVNSTLSISTPLYPPRPLSSLPSHQATSGRSPSWKLDKGHWLFLHGSYSLLPLIPPLLAKVSHLPPSLFPSPCNMQFDLTFESTQKSSPTISLPLRHIFTPPLPTCDSVMGDVSHLRLLESGLLPFQPCHPFPSTSPPTSPSHLSSAPLTVCNPVMGNDSLCDPLMGNDGRLYIAASPCHLLPQLSLLFPLPSPHLPASLHFALPFLPSPHLPSPTPHSQCAIQ